MSTRYTVLLESFQAGEVSPLLRGRVDTSQNSQGCRTIENFIVLPQGGITRRNGSYYATEVEDSTETSRLVPFVSSDASGTTSFMLEFGDNVVRPFSTNADGFAENEGSGTVSASNVLNQEFASNIDDWSFSDTSQGSSSMAVAWNAGNGGQARFTGSFSAPESSVGYIEQTFTLAAGTYRFYTRAFTQDAGGGAYNILVRDSGASQVLSDSKSFNSTPDPTYYAQVDLDGDDYTLFLTASMAESDTRDVHSIVVEKVTETSSTPYSSDDAGEIQLQQIGDNKGISVHPSYPIRVFDTSTWTFNVMNLTEGPFFNIDHEDYGGRGSGITLSTAGEAVGNTVTLTSSADLFASTDSDASGRGRLVRIRPNSSSVWGVGEITDYSSAQSVTITVRSTVASCTNTAEWRLGSWSDTTGWPRTATIFEQRLVCGGTTAQPQTIWGSYVDDYTNFAPDDGSADENITDLSAYSFTLDTPSREVIQWLLARESLLVGTTAQIHRVRATNLNEALTARNVVARPMVGVGCAKIDPVVSQDDILFIHFFTRQMLQVQYNFDTDRQEAINLHLLAEHFTDTNPITGIAVQDYPYRLIWNSLTDGQLGSLTNSPQSQTNAWSRHHLGGSLTGSTYPVVESIAAKPGASQDELWLVVRRTIDGNTVKSVEVIGRQQTSSAARTTDIYLDSHIIGTITSGEISWTSAPVTDMSHLEGQTVTVLRNGVSQGTDMVTSGDLATIDYSTWDDDDVIVVGLSFTSTIETNTLEAPPQHGTLQGFDQRIYETTLRLWNSFSGQIGYNTASLENIVYPSDINPSLEASDTFGGDITNKLPMGWQRDSRILIKTATPYPFTLTLLINKLVYGSN